MNSIQQFLSRIRADAVKRPQEVTTVAMGRERVFHALDLGPDTFIFEAGVAHHLEERPSILLAEKSSLRRKAKGWVMTLTTGNHSVAAFPLLDGRFWGFSNLHSSKRGEVLMHSIICANVVNGVIETSQRDVPSKLLYRADSWLRGTLGFTLSDIVMGERNATTLQHYRELGQEWRVRPLAWTEREIKAALAASRKRMSTGLNYYHSARGVHFLSFSEFKRYCGYASTDPEEFVRGLKELVAVYEGQECSFTRMKKYRGHHEIEFFGIRRGVALERLVPEIEQLMESVVLGRIGQLGMIQKASELVALYESLLTNADLGDDTSVQFIETLYMYITGEIYSVVGEGSTPAFDDRRTALPGATFVDGRPVMHPGADDRSEVLLSNIRSLMSKDEIVEYANVYELRDVDGTAPIGRGKTREVVYKTNRSPLEQSLIEKRLSRTTRHYGSYMLARVEALKALGVSLSEYRILRRRSRSGSVSTADFFIRRRCEGEPMDSVPANYFCNADDSSMEEKEVVLALAALMGDAAAQNMAMKKYDPKTGTPLYGIGKEIYEFEYDILAGRVMPKRVSTCSIRGSFGWPDLTEDDDNLLNIANFYLGHYAHALKIYQRRHGVTMAEVAERFMGGFEFRTHAMEWQLSVMRDRFEDFDPKLPSSFRFNARWRFVMWSLERQERRLPILRKLFFKKVELMENESLRNNSEPVRI